MGKKATIDPGVEKEAAPTSAQGAFDLPDRGLSGGDDGGGLVRPGRELKRPAAKAAKASPLFPAGGEAFELFAARRGIVGPIPDSQLPGLLREFADTPILGHRRSGSKPGHRANPEHLRS